MADTKISALPSASALTGTEQIPATQNGTNPVKLTVDQISSKVQGDISIQTFTAVALTNPYTASKSPHRIGDIALNLTSLEIWQANSATPALTSWNRMSSGYYGGSIITDLNMPISSGCYTALGTASNVPNSSYSWFIDHINSNTGNVSAYQRAVAYSTTIIIYERTKIGSVWGAWSKIESFTTAYKNQVDQISANGVTELNIDKLYPLSSGYYTLSTAIAAVSSQLRSVNAKITFKSAANTVETWQFKSTIENWLDTNSWELLPERSEISGILDKVQNIYDFSDYEDKFIICDNNGNVIFKIDSEGMHSNNVNSLTFEQITATIAKVYSSSSFSKVFFSDSKLAGKNMLAIGDSLTAANKWQTKTAEILGCSQVTHALGGAGLINFVDAGSTSVGSIADLKSSDVSGVDVIVILGPYNSRILMGNIGNKTDMYPTQDTLWGEMNYVFKRIYEELLSANNLTCKIFFAGCHAHGKNAYLDKTAYEEYPSGSGYTVKDFSDKLKEICGWNGIEFIDLFNNSGINSYTWNKYQATSQPNSTSYIGYTGGREIGINDPFPDLNTLNNSIVSDGFISGDTATVTGYLGYYKYNGISFDAIPVTTYSPWIADQLHCNDAGYNLIGNYIANRINSFINN